jgi:regulation of enolase protein 1 (concanavalin A-like superfamily)
LVANHKDDSNGELLPSNICWLRINRKGDFWGLHYSLNGEQWRFIRCFGLDLPSIVKVGFGIAVARSCCACRKFIFAEFTDARNLNVCTHSNVTLGVPL